MTMARFHRRLQPCALLFGLMVLGTGSSSWADPATDLLEKLEKRRAQVRTLQHATRTTSRAGDVLHETSSRSWEKHTGKSWKIRRSTKVKTSSKGGKSTREVETLTVVDGKHEWRQMPVGDKTMVFKAKASAVKGLEEVRRALHSGKPRVKGHESIRQEPCVVLEIVGGGTSDRFKATYWISESYGVVLKSTVTRADRSRTEMETTEFAANAPIEDKRFIYEPPEGATVVDTGMIGTTPGGKKKP